MRTGPKPVAFDLARQPSLVCFVCLMLDCWRTRLLSQSRIIHTQVSSCFCTTKLCSSIACTIENQQFIVTLYNEVVQLDCLHNRELTVHCDSVQRSCAARLLAQSRIIHTQVNSCFCTTKLCSAYAIESCWLFSAHGVCGSAQRSCAVLARVESYSYSS